jgi:Domain of unknown function (DUF4384)
MTARKQILSRVAFTALFACLALSAQPQQLTARDAFWSSSDLITVDPNPGTPEHLNASGNVNAPGSTQRSPHPSKAEKLVTQNGYGTAPRLLSGGTIHLGLRCSILLRQTDGGFGEVAPGNVFHSGDKIRLSFLANAPGYFYIIQQGSTGSWRPLIPTPNDSKDANRILAGHVRIVPDERNFTFDRNPGNERLYVILSKSRIADIDQAVENLRASQSPAPQKQAGAGSALEADGTIPDALVKELASRDLVLEDEQQVEKSSTDAGSAEKAIYVVSKGSGANPANEVRLSLDLRHE